MGTGINPPGQATNYGKPTFRETLRYFFGHAKAIRGCSSGPNNGHGIFVYGGAHPFFVKDHGRILKRAKGLGIIRVNDRVKIRFVFLQKGPFPSQIRSQPGLNKALNQSRANPLDTKQFRFRSGKNGPGRSQSRD